MRILKLLASLYLKYILVGFVKLGNSVKTRVFNLSSSKKILIVNFYLKNKYSALITNVENPTKPGKPRLLSPQQITSIHSFSRELFPMLEFEP